MRLLIGLLYLFYGTVDGDAAGEDLMLHHVLKNNTIANDTSFNKEALQNSTPLAQPVVAPAGDGSTEGDNKTLFVLGILVSFCVFAVIGVVMTVMCWVKVFSTPKKPKDSDLKTKETENLDKRNMRDVQLTEYEKRKRQMKELDNTPEEPTENGAEESDDGGELDEITAVQSQPLEEETIVNPHFIHHYVPTRQSSR